MTQDEFYQGYNKSLNKIFPIPFNMTTATIQELTTTTRPVEKLISLFFLPASIIVDAGILGPSLIEYGVNGGFKEGG